MSILFLRFIYILRATSPYYVPFKNLHAKKKKKNLFKDFQKNSILEIQRSPLIAPFNRATIATAPPIFTEHFLRAASSSRHAFLRVRGTPCHEFPAFEYKT